MMKIINVTVIIIIIITMMTKTNTKLYQNNKGDQQ